jgi:alanyl-tRNA synthetase
MKSLSGSEIRRLFLDFFRENGHEIVPSSSLVPADDPSLLFTNAGMVQFKKVFQGEEVRENRRAASSQKCVRAGGKHNDLENVGYTARHHTFFEMLGNFSFGDYFKEEAIALAWRFLTDVIGMSRENLWITVYNDDDEAEELWRRVASVAPDRIVRMGEKDNFWAMGDTGPCGPCSEIHLDQGEAAGCGRPDCRLGCDCDRFLEIWNLVFMQFFRDESGKMTPLPEPCIDTGMGLERIAAVCQGKTNNFDTDIFSGIMAKLGDISGIPYGSTEKTDVAMRVIADHSRAAAFLIADGVIPSNERRGYVLRRLIRRSARYGRSLGVTPPFMHHPVQVIMEEMGDVYPELEKEAGFIFDILKHEEEQFARTLEKGMGILEEKLAGLQKDNVRAIPGDFIFRLYDTYGLPIDIVRDIAKEQGFELDRPDHDIYGNCAERFLV